MKTGPNSQVEIKKPKCPDGTDFVTYYKHESVNDDDLDNEVIHNWQVARKELCNALMDFLLPERVAPEEYKRYMYDFNTYASSLKIFSVPTDYAIPSYANEYRHLMPSTYKSERLKFTTQDESFKLMHKYIKVFLKKYIKNDINVKRTYINDLPNWKQVDEDGNLITPDNYEEKPKTDEFTVEGIVNHTLSSGLDGEFTITPWMAHQIEVGIAYGLVGWRRIIVLNAEKMTAGFERLEHIQNSTLTIGKYDFANSQVLYGILGGMAGEDGFSQNEVKAVNVEERGNWSRNGSTGGNNCGVGWIGLTLVTTKKSCADLAGITWINWNTYEEGAPGSLAYATDAEWGALTKAYYYKNAKSYENKPFNSIYLFFECEEPDEDELTDIACAILAMKTGAGILAHERGWYPDIDDGWKKRLLISSWRTTRFNGNGRTCCHAWLTSWFLGQYGKLKNEGQESKYDIDELKKTINDKFDIPENVTYEWPSAVDGHETVFPAGFVPIPTDHVP